MITVIQPDPVVPIDRFGPWLEEEGQQLRYVALAEQPVPALADCGDAILLLGGTMNAVDADASPWLPQLRQLVRDAVAADVPIMGICLGHQILATALGGEVTVSHPTEGEKGPVRVTLTEQGRQDPVYCTLDESPLVAHGHFDAVTKLPEGATLLAYSEASRNQTFRVGSALGMQFHPEVRPETMGVWTDIAGGDGPAMQRDMEAVDAEIIAVGRRIAKGFSDWVNSTRG